MEALLSSLKQDPGSPKKHEVVIITATTYGHLLGILQKLFAILVPMWHSIEYYPHVTVEDTEDQKVYLHVNNEPGL